MPLFTNGTIPNGQTPEQVCLLFLLYFSLPYGRLAHYPESLRIGIHTSTAGSLERAALKAAELGANTFQIFSASPRMWRASRPDAEQIRKLQLAREQHDLTPLVIHDNYLINLASADPGIREKSRTAFCGEMERALLIGAEYLVAHPGNYKGQTPEQGCQAVIESLVFAWRGVDPELKRGKPQLTILLENTVGAGAQIGGKFEEIAIIQQYASQYLDLPVGFCIDTCHCLGAGYDIATEAGLEQTVKEMDRVLGLGHIPVIHANDSKKPLGSHVDRHAHIGDGYIGFEGFRRILNHPKLREKAFILETPVDEPGDDLRNVMALKELVSRNERLTTKKSS